MPSRHKTTSADIIKPLSTEVREGRDLLTHIQHIVVFSSYAISHGLLCRIHNKGCEGPLPVCYSWISKIRVRNTPVTLNSDFWIRDKEHWSFNQVYLWRRLFCQNHHLEGSVLWNRIVYVSLVCLICRSTSSMSLVKNNRNFHAQKTQLYYR